MDDRTFDARVRALGNSANRRAVLGGLAALAGLGVAQASAKPPKRGKVRGSAAADKVTICHYDKDAGTYTKISVGAKAAESHLEHHEGDYSPKGNCCSDTDCSSSQRCDGANGCITCSGAGFQCYWLGPTSDGGWAWKPATWVGGGRAACLATDQCSSGGGCYAWMDTTLCRG